MPLSSLPAELLYTISEHLRDKCALSALVMTSHRFFLLCNKLLYRFDVQQCSSSALLCAAKNGVLSTAEMSLTERSSTGTRDNQAEMALHLSVEKESHTIVKLLVDRGIDVNSPGRYFRYALQAASWSDDQEMKKMLIDLGANINEDGGRFGSTLHAASWAGNEEAAKILLGHSALLGNALQFAVENGHHEVAELHLDNDADANAPVGWFGSALQTASWPGNQKMMRLLLDRGVNVNAVGGHWGNSLQAASWACNEETVKILLDRGADVNVQGGCFGNALQGAS
jgi:ankyrin repeat protein